MDLVAGQIFTYHGAMLNQWLGLTWTSPTNASLVDIEPGDILA